MTHSIKTLPSEPPRGNLLWGGFVVLFPLLPFR